MIKKQIIIYFLAGITSTACAYQNFDEAFAAGTENKKNKKYDLAIKDLNAALEMTRQQRNAVLTIFELASCYYCQKNYAEAIRLCTVLRNNPQTMEYLRYRAGVIKGFCYYFQKNYAEAIETFEQSMNAPDAGSESYTSEASYFLAQSYYFLKEYAKAQAQYERVLKRRNLEAWMQANALVNLGLCYYAQGDYANAKKKFETALEDKTARKGFQADLEKRLKICEEKLK